MVREGLRRGVRLYTKLRYGLGSRLLVAASPRLGEALDARPIPGDWIEEGSPEASARFLATSPDGGLAFGFWHCTAGRFRWHFDCDEIVYILSGSVDVEHEGRAFRLEPGSVAFFPVGTSARWTVRDHVRKLFVHRHPAPLARKWAGLA